ncbi:helix-turn-helix transcriptional regulator [Amycolatopsis alba]|uniref:helix-turn-helix transcriptional regulator n=1 Tax=Amycolatopsis alba TaxID=76020 RepID=UPI0003743573|nr:helix-turn-helix transcriptional regulator [Amycolatopsis alba]
MTATRSACSTPDGPVHADDLRRLDDVTEIDALFDELHRQVKFRARVVSPGESDFAAPAGSARIQYQTLVRRHEMATFSQRNTQPGEFRVREHLPFRMVHVDDRIAAVSVAGRSTDSTFVIRSPLLLGLLAEWFDLLWSAPGTTAPAGTPSATLTSNQRQVLGLLQAHGDETIARLLGISATTVRRHVKAIYEKFGVNNRFAAGVAAAKLGWL